jgi:hypothetical protein
LGKFFACPLSFERERRDFEGLRKIWREREFDGALL